MLEGQRRDDTAKEWDTCPGKDIAYLVALSALFGSCFTHFGVCN